ncbi:hypothetical protein A6V36_09675 [Paraburkholderia ginsengiterrae]|uniref:DUF445 domain-containing protein n=2 Tax=Paraburkholderia ginsengiterrae TaxID=1462993 RepID=A0A1A9N9L7_9BURK|nr:hypothetical protein A6V36_09675 [Paraburkholderia ginsengiterrae]OAJ61304.1 hypothetical protein A6V37_04000 [Paraburkholderia ginsengiterrae]
MRRTATCLLVLMIALLGVCVVWQGRYPSLALARAFAEAGTIGAIADWYAVVALFRRPFGLPIPHTAIIPRNQQRIAESLGNFVEEHFLTPELIVGRLGGYNAAQALAGWLAEPPNSQAIADVVTAALPELLNGIDETQAARWFDSLVLPQLRTLDVSRAAGGILAVLTDRDRHQPLLDRGLATLETWLTVNVEMIKAKFSAASRFTPAPIDNYIVNKFVEGIIALLHEVAANPEHALRRQFDEAMRDLIVQLQSSPVHRRFGRSLMRDCLRYLREGGYERVLLDHVRACVSADLERAQPVLGSVTAAMLVALGKGLGSDPSMQHRLNAWWLALARSLVVRFRSQLSMLITEVVKSWNAEDVSRKIETEIGRDLQYIRINGTFVGGLVGVLLHIATVVAAQV